MNASDEGFKLVLKELINPKDIFFPLFLGGGSSLFSHMMPGSSCCFAPSGWVRSRPLLQARLSHADWAAPSLSCLLTQRGNVPAANASPGPPFFFICSTDKRAIWQQHMTRARQSTPCFVLVQSWSRGHHQQAASAFDPAVIVSGVLTSSTPVVVSQRRVKPCNDFMFCLNPPSHCQRRAGPVSPLTVDLIRLYVPYLLISYLLILCRFLSFLWSSSCLSSLRGRDRTWHLVQRLSNLHFGHTVWLKWQ